MKQLIVPLTAALLLTGCSKKSDPQAALPPATQEGRNTGGCLIDGQPFVATGWPSGSLFGGTPTDPLEGGFYEDSLYYLQLAGRVNGEKAAVTLFLRSRTPGRHLLNLTTPTLDQGGLRRTLDHATYEVRGANSETYITDAQHTGSIVLTQANLNAGLSAGTFEFTAVSTLDKTKTVTITQGRFDRKQ